MDRPILQRLVLDFRTAEIVVRCLYHSKGDSNPGTKTRTKEISALAKTALEQALEALEGRVEVVSRSGFTTREDVVLCTDKGVACPDVHKKVKKGA
jgi:hypothetical protein